MFTNNYKNLLRNRVLDSLGVIDGYSWEEVQFAYTGNHYGITGGNPIYLDTAMSKICPITSFTATPPTSSYDMGIVLGDGTADATAEDIVLSGNLITGNTITSANTTIARTMEDDGENASITSVLTITNTSDSDITISEVGLCGYMYLKRYSNSSGSYYAPVLYERTLLEDPVTIPAGGIGQITYTITISMPA